MIQGLLLLLALALPIGAHAATLYVNNSGSPACSDATSKAGNSASTPWCTIARSAWGSTTYASPNASEAAAAGDLVLVQAGTYTENGNPSGNRFTAALNPANSGTVSNPITFRGVGTVEIRMANTYRGGTIGADGRDYIIWDHFLINDYYQGSTSDTGPVVFHVTTGSQLVNSEIMGHPGSYYHGYATFGGNYRLVSIEPADGVVIKNNRIHRAHLDNTGVGGQNEACVMLYDADTTMIEHNEIYDCGTGVFVKGQHEASVPTGNVIRYNLVYDHDSGGLRVWYGEATKFYQNIVHGCNTGISLQADVSASSRVVNNTIYNNTNGIIVVDSPSVVDLDFNNNLITHNTYAFYSWPTANYGSMAADFVRNWYYANTNHVYGEGFGSINFSTWQGTYSEDVNGVDGTDPQYTNAAGGNFHIANATALITGRVVESIGGTNGDTIPVGAYISGTEEIGIESGAGSGSSAPRFAPNLLRRADSGEIQLVKR